MMKIRVSKKKSIKFINMQARRVGKGIRILRESVGFTSKQVAEKVGITDIYLNRLEDGLEPEVDRETLEKVVQTLGVYSRGNIYTNDDIINIFLHYSSTSYYTRRDDEPRLI